MIITQYTAVLQGISNIDPATVGVELMRREIHATWRRQCYDWSIAHLLRVVSNLLDVG